MQQIIGQLNRLQGQLISVEKYSEGYLGLSRVISRKVRELTSVGIHVILNPKTNVWILMHDDLQNTSHYHQN
jgi:hypothetical protein